MMTYWMAVQSVNACGNDVEVTKIFLYLDSLFHNDSESYQRVAKRIALAHQVNDSFKTSIWHC